MAGDKQDPRLRCPKDATYMEKVASGTLTSTAAPGAGAVVRRAELDRVLSGRRSMDLVQKLDIGAIGRGSGRRVLGKMVCPRDRSS